MLTIQKSPFLKLDKQRVIGILKSAGSRDADVLHSHKAELESIAKFPKLAGIYMMVVGALCTMLILTAFIGIPLLILGWWVRRRGVASLQAVEEGFAEFTGSALAA